MTKENKRSVEVIHQHAPVGFVMFAAFIGSLLYFLRHANDFGDVLLAFVKAIFWPGVMAYHIFQALGA